MYRDGVPRFASQPEEPNPDPVPVKTNGHANGRTNGHRGPKRTEATPIPPNPTGAKRWPPKDGTEFYAWLKDRDKESPGIFKHITQWAALRKMPVRILSWGSEATKVAYEEAHQQLTKLVLAGQDNSEND